MLHPKEFTPTGDKVALQVIRVEPLARGIVMPENMPESRRAEARGESLRALVVAAGPDCKQVKRGDMIVLAPMPAILPIKINNRDCHCLLHEEEVVAVIDEPEEVKVKRIKEADRRAAKDEN